MWWASFKYLLAGLVIGIIALLFLVTSQGFLDRSSPARLIVMQIDRQKEDDHHRTGLGRTWHYTYRPVFALDTKARPRPEYAGNVWMSPAPHQVGEVVPGRYDPLSGEMQSDKMIGNTIWVAWLALAIGLLCILQAVLLLFGLPEILMPVRVRFGGQA